MERWLGRVALVTGARAGIGAAITRELVNKGMRVVGLDKMEGMKNEVRDASGELHALTCDVTKESDILNGFDWINKNLGGVDILVNNAGIARDVSAMGGATQDWRDTFETNVIGLSICTREALKSMRSRGVDDGHIVNLNSIAGHGALSLPGIAAYAASKHGVAALSEALRWELAAARSRVKVTNISPGAVRTDILQTGAMKDLATLFAKHPMLAPQDVADAVLYVLGTPPHVVIHQLTIRPVGEMY